VVSQDGLCPGQDCKFSPEAGSKAVPHSLLPGPPPPRLQPGRARPPRVQVRGPRARLLRTLAASIQMTRIRVAAWPRSRARGDPAALLLNLAVQAGPHLNGTGELEPAGG
jgi:hypothetical protein